MKKEIRILETSNGRNCKHDMLNCLHCGSVVFTHEHKQFNVNKFKELSKKILELENEK